jgi:hypothetical protein
MEINLGSEQNASNQSSDSKKTQNKEPSISLPEIQEINNLNFKHIKALERDSSLYMFKQDRRDISWAQTELEIHESIQSLKSNVESIKENLNQINKDFTIIAKNFKTYVKTDELNHVKNKIDSFKFEQLVTEDELKKELKNL